MKSKLVPLMLSLVFAGNCFAQSQVSLKDIFPKNFFYEPAEINFFKKPKFQLSDGQVLDILYDKYALKDLGINEAQFLRHLELVTSLVFDFFKDKEFTGQVGVKMNLTLNLQDKKIEECAQEPVKCSMNLFEFVLPKEYTNKNLEALSQHVLDGLIAEGEKKVDWSENISEPIVNNFNYIGAFNSALLLNLTPKGFASKKDEEKIKAQRKILSDIVYPNGEDWSKEYSVLQQKFVDRAERLKKDKPEIAKSEAEQTEKTTEEPQAQIAPIPTEIEQDKQSATPTATEDEDLIALQKELEELMKKKKDSKEKEAQNPKPKPKKKQRET